MPQDIHEAGTLNAFPRPSRLEQFSCGPQSHSVRIHLNREGSSKGTSSFFLFDSFGPFFRGFEVRCAYQILETVIAQYCFCCFLLSRDSALNGVNFFQTFLQQSKRNSLSVSFVSALPSSTLWTR